jgi:hypothetical protein
VKQGLFAGLTAALALATSVAWAAGGEDGVPSTAVNEQKPAELQKKIPISKQGEPRTIVQLDMPPVESGDTVEAHGQLEVSVTCLEPMPKCVGKLYEYSPKVEARLVLAQGTQTSGLPVGEPEQITCSQDLPNRNHHCVIDVKRNAVLDRTPACAPDCSLNLVLRASHRRARQGNVLVIGADQDDGIAQNRAALSAGVFEADGVYDPVVLTTTERVVNSVDVDPNDTKEVTVASIRLDRLTEGEVLAVEAKAVTSIGHLPYNVLSQGQIVMSEQPNSSENHGIPLSVSTRNGQLGAENGFNCTQGRSAHSNPCAIEKSGFVKILKSARERPNHNAGDPVPLYVNFFVGFEDVYAQGGRPYQRGDKVKIESVKLEIRRYSQAGRHTRRRAYNRSGGF